MNVMNKEGGNCGDVPSSGHGIQPPPIMKAVAMPVSLSPALPQAGEERFVGRWRDFHGKRLLVLSGLLFLLLVLQLAFAGPRSYFAEAQNLTGTFPQGVWQSMTTFGDCRALFAVLLPISLLNRKLVWQILLAILIGWLISKGLRFLVPIPRPSAQFIASGMAMPSSFLGRSSFPSGHTVVAFSFIGVLLGSLPRIWTIPLFVFASLVGLSRVAIGLHWPADVLAGALIGCLSAYAVVWLSRACSWCVKRYRGNFVLSLLLWLSVMTLPFIDIRFQQTFALRLVVTCISLCAFCILYGHSVLKGVTVTCWVSGLLHQRIRRSEEGKQTLKERSVFPVQRHDWRGS